MAARTSTEEQKRRRRKRLLQGLVLGSAAVGLPALANVLVARRVGRLPAASWGRGHRYAWRFGEITFQRIGSGPPVLLLHSFGPGYDAEQWRDAAELLARERTVLAPDLLGWGRSEKPPITYDGELYIRLVSDFLADVVRERAVVVAAGLAAAYAVQVAVDRPEAVRGLGLVAPEGLDLHGDEPDLRDAVVHRILGLPILGTSALNLYTSRAGLTRYLRSEAYARPERVDAAVVEHHYRSSHQSGAHRALAAYLAGYLNHRAGPVLARLRQPLWLAWGRESRSPAVESADLWLREAPTAKLEVFEQCGSLPHVELPGRFVQQLDRFLSRLPA